MSGQGQGDPVSTPATGDVETASHRTSGTSHGRLRGQRAPRRLGQIPGGRHGLAPEAVAESQRSRLLAAMAEAVCEQGFAETSISDVIARAGVSRKTFYQQFDGKDDCFATAYGLEVDRLSAVALAAFEAEGGPWARRLRAALTALCGALAANPGTARLCFVEGHDAGPLTAARRRDALAGLLPLFEDAPAEAIGSDLGESLRMGRIGDLAEILRHEIDAGAGPRLPRLVPELAYLMAVPFLGPERAVAELGGTAASSAR
ncbi:MAG: TetR/AcrR family transcriptional regulator [Solirubrobacterales bacterium]|nr:TetR/AcrR family transcriptional regulator [Solirubrobacterales bacterium]